MKPITKEEIARLAIRRYQGRICLVTSSYELEQALRTNRPFLYDYQPSRVPVLAGGDYWAPAKGRQTGDFIDVFLADPSLCRLYLGLSKPDPETAAELRKNIPMERLKAFAHVLDFFGSMFEIREGRAVVPGGARSARVWEELVGASPNRAPASSSA